MFDGEKTEKVSSFILSVCQSELSDEKSGMSMIR